MYEGLGETLEGSKSFVAHIRDGVGGIASQLGDVLDPDVGLEGIDGSAVSRRFPTTISDGVDQ